MSEMGKFRLPYFFCKKIEKKLSRLIKLITFVELIDERI